MRCACARLSKPRGPRFLLPWFFGWMYIIPDQAIFADLDSLVLLFDGFRQFYGGSALWMARRFGQGGRFNYGESVVHLAEKVG
jgi:hypothetical protein